MAETLNSQEIMARAQALIDEAERQLNATDDFFRNQGLDPAKVRAVLAAHTTAQAEADARAAFEADMRAVEQEVAEGKARLSHGTPASPARRPRPMV